MIEDEGGAQEGSLRLEESVLGELLFLRAEVGLRGGEWNGFGERAIGEFEPVESGAVFRFVGFDRRDKTDGSGVLEIGRLLVLANGDGLGVESEPSGIADAEDLAVPLVLVGEWLLANEPLLTDFEGQVQFRLPDILGADGEVEVRRGQIERFLEIEGEQGGTFALAVPDVVRVVLDLGMIGELQLSGTRAKAFESEKVGSEVLVGDWDVGLDVITEVFAEERLGV